MSSSTLAPALDGFDPLATDENPASSIAAVLNEASKRIVHNILKSYTGYFDLFSELLQNSLDAVEQRKKAQPANYQPTDLPPIFNPGIMRLSPGLDSPRLRL